MEDSDFEDELSMVLSMFSDECRVRDDDPHCLIAHLELGFVFELLIPKKGYPQQRRPELSVTSGPNAVLCSKAERSARDAVALRVPSLDEGGGGFPVLVAMVLACQDVVSDLALELEATRSSQLAAATRAAEEEQDDAGPLEFGGSGGSCVDCAGIHILQGEPIVDRKSKFIAHIAKIHSVEEVELVVAALRSNKHIAAAAHPAIVAYRFRSLTNGGLLHQDSDDDGETGAAKKILFLLEQLKVEGVVVVVTRWFGGILLGPDRFKHIMNCAKQALIDHKLVVLP